MAKAAKKSNNRRVKLFIIILFAATSYYVYYSTIGSGPLSDSQLELPKIPKVEVPPPEEYGQLNLILDNPSCKLIDLPLEDLTLHYHLSKIKVQRIKCHTPIAKLTEDNRIQLAKLMVNCCYKEIIRVNQTMAKYDRKADNVIKYGSCKFLSFDGNMTSLEKVQAPAFVLSCFNYFYSPQESFSRPLPPEEYTIETRRKAKFWSTYPKEVRPPSIVIIGIDSVSRLQFLRTMPKTKAILKSRGYLQLKGYSRVGLNTFPNLMAMLADMKTIIADNEEFKIDCTPKGRHSSLTPCPFIWKNFSALNFITAYQEDAPSYTTFNYAKTGFVDVPTDYYSRPFFIDLDLNDVLCPEGVNRTVFLQRYTEALLRNVGSKTPLFSITWFNEQTHDNMVNLKSEDDTFAGFIDNISKIDPNAFIFFISDHGFRTGEFRETFRGYYEESLPFFFLRIPKSIKSQFPHWVPNFKTNKLRLTSTFDMHATLEEIMIEASKHQAYKKVGGQPIKRRAKYTSLFQEIPKNRSCTEAGIEKEWCRCGDYPEIITTFTEKTRDLMNSIISRINSHLAGEIKAGRCAELELERFMMGRRISHNSTTNSSEHLLTFATRPGGGVFEGRIRGWRNGSSEIIGEISRINIYGESSKCVESTFLKLYCFCLGV